MTIFAVTLHLAVKGQGREEHFENVTDCYAALEAKDEQLLDCSWDYSERDTHAYVDVDVTVTADNEATAHELASASVRTAIHEAGGFTPSWGDLPPDLASVVYRLTDEEIEVVPA